MAKLKSDYVLGEQNLWYEILSDGYDIYIHENDPNPWMHQPEPFIPYRKPTSGLSEEEQALSDYEYACFKHMEQLCTPREAPVDPTEERFTRIETDVASTQEGLAEVYEIVLTTAMV